MYLFLQASVFYFVCFYICGSYFATSWHFFFFFFSCNAVTKREMTIMKVLHKKFKDLTKITRSPLQQNHIIDLTAMETSLHWLEVVNTFDQKQQFLWRIEDLSKNVEVLSGITNSPKCAYCAIYQFKLSPFMTYSIYSLLLYNLYQVHDFFPVMTPNW